MKQLKNWGKCSYIMAIWLLILWNTTGCSSLQNPMPTNQQVITSSNPMVLKVSGSGSVTTILTALKPTFEADTPGYQLEVLSGTGTGGGVRGVLDGTLDIAAMARPPQADETAQGVAYVKLGVVGQAIIIHPDVDIAGLSNAQVKQIFLGEISNWAEVGGPELPLILYLRDEEDSSTQSLRRAVIGDIPLADNPAQILTSQRDMLDNVANTPGSVGIATWPAARALEANVQAVTIDGFMPEEPTYLMTNEIGLGYTQQTHIQPLIDWLGSERGQTTLGALGVMIGP